MGGKKNAASNPIAKAIAKTPPFNRRLHLPHRFIKQSPPAS
jgi:hypothetical protein